MKAEDIDKKIGMPDVDEEWAKFERKVLGEETKPQKRVLIGWTIGIAASIAILAGIFFWDNDTDKLTDSGKQLAQTANVQIQEERKDTEVDAPHEDRVSNNSSGNAAANNDKDITPVNAKDNPSGKSFAQATPPTQDRMEVPTPAVVNSTDNVFSVVEQQPSFPGGNRALQEFIKKNLRYPSTAQAYGANGRVAMQFKIDSLGYISNIKAIKFLLKYDTVLLNRETEVRQMQLKEQIAQELEEECTRVIALMPRWSPGRVCGKTVSMKYVLPFRFNLSDSLANASDFALQGRITGHDNVANSSSIGKDEMLTRGKAALLTSNDSVLILVNGAPQSDGDAKKMLRRDFLAYFYQRQQMIDTIMVYKGEQAKQRYMQQYGKRVKNGVIDIITVPDTLSNAYVRQHPEVMKSRRHLSGYVINDETNEPLAFAQINPPRIGLYAMTDSTGHFDFWPPQNVDTLWGLCTGFQTLKFQVADDMLTIRLTPKKVEVFPGDSRKNRKSTTPAIRIR